MRNDFAGCLVVMLLTVGCAEEDAPPNFAEAVTQGGEVSHLGSCLMHAYPPANHAFATGGIDTCLQRQDLAVRVCLQEQTPHAWRNLSCQSYSLHDYRLVGISGRAPLEAGHAYRTWIFAEANGRIAVSTSPITRG